MLNMEIVGGRCKEIRKKKGRLQGDVARATGYTLENISKFECGKNDNYRILWWYLKNGLKISDLLSCEYSEDKK